MRTMIADILKQASRWSARRNGRGGGRQCKYKPDLVTMDVMPDMGGIREIIAEDQTRI